jgi:hypothetical protein
MSDPEKDGVAAAQMSGPEYDQVTQQMRQRDEQLKRQLRLARIFVRVMDVGFG